MSFRIGQCSSCGASYKLPASFEADQARCKNCGGVVQIGKAGEPAPSAAAPPVPAKKPAAAATPKPKPKRSGPSMKERLIAERKAAEAAEKKSPAAPKRAAGKASAAPVKAATAKRVASPAKSAATPKTGAAKRSASGSRRSARGKSDESADSGSSRSGRRRAAPEKKKSPMGAIIGVVALLAIGGGAFFFMNQDSGTDPDEVNAAGENAEDVAENGTDGGEPTLEDSTTGEENSSTDSATSDEPEAAAPELTDEEKAAAATAAEAAASAKAAKDAAANDPASVDLTAIADFEPFAGTSPDRVLELEDWTTTMMDPMAGAAGNRAKKKLVDAGREAMPIIINALKRLDLTDDDGFRSADVSQKALQEICNGNNFGWKYPSQEPDRFHLFDKKVIRSWTQAWAKAATDDDYWAKLAKLDSVEAAASEEPEEEAVDDALDALDDF